MDRQNPTKPFGKHARLIVREEEPFNAGPPPELLCQSFVTPTDLFFVRNHGSVPRIDPETYCLSITGMVNMPLKLSLDDLRRRFARETVIATLQCAGHRRDELVRVSPVKGEVPWGAEAVSNARWGGACLRDILRAAGVHADALHVAFLGMDEVEMENQKFGFGSSIPIEKALSPEVILAYEMNDEPLPLVHGFPLRAVVPGYIGARSVKWLASVRLQTHPSDNYFQTHAYKLFPPQVQAAEADWASALALNETWVNSVICHPPEKATIREGVVLISGYAVASGGHNVERVEVSFDEGETWRTAKLHEGCDKWTWCFWTAELQLKPGSYAILARSRDSAGNTQPEKAEEVWNFKGYMNNSWHRVEVTVQAKD